MRRNKLLEFFASPPTCLVGLEASGSAHHWARELVKLGHEAIRAHVRSHMDKGVISKMAVPDRIMIVENLPLTSVGKVDKKVLRDMQQREDAA